MATATTSATTTRSKSAARLGTPIRRIGKAVWTRRDIGAVNETPPLDAATAEPRIAGEVAAARLWLLEQVRHPREGSVIYNMDRAMALALWERNNVEGRRNRRLDRRRVADWSTVMLDGRWKLNGQPIILDVEGFLMTGQHRVAGFLRATDPAVKGSNQNLRIKVHLQFGISRDAMSTIDTGKTQTPADKIVIEHDDKDARNLVSALLLADRILAGTLPGSLKDPTDHDRVLELRQAYPEMPAFLRRSMKLSKVIPPSKSTIAACWCLFSRINHHDADDFFAQIQALNGGTMNAIPSPAIQALCRNFANARATKSVRGAGTSETTVPQYAWVAQMIMAWQRRNDKDAERITWNKKKFPDLVVSPNAGDDADSATDQETVHAED